MQRNPTWLVDVSTGSAWRAVGRGGEIGTLFKRTFGDGKPGQVLGTPYLIAALPD